MKILMDILYCILYIAPFAVIRYYPFRNSLRFPVRTICIIYGSILSFEAISFCYLTVQPFWNSNLTQVFRTSFVFALAALSFTLVKEDFFKQFFVWALTYAIAGLTMTNAYFIESRFFPKIAISLPHEIANLVAVIQILVFFPLIFRCMDKMIVPLIRAEGGRVWKIVWMMPILLYSGTFLATWSLDIDKVSSISFLLIRIFCFGIMIVISLVLAEVIRQTSENVRLHENARTMNIQLALQEDEYIRLNEHISETKRARHDLRHHLAVMEAFLKSNDKESLSDYLIEYKSALLEDEELALCENLAANAIVTHYAGLAKAEGVSLLPDLVIPMESGISGADICIVLGNCLENALEACRRIKDGLKFINIKAEPRGNMIVFLIDNSFDGNVVADGDRFLSSKRDGNGIGVFSVKAVAKKYGGTAKFEYSENIFRVSIMLQTC